MSSALVLFRVWLHCTGTDPSVALVQAGSADSAYDALIWRVNATASTFKDSSHIYLFKRNAASSQRLALDINLELTLIAIF